MSLLYLECLRRAAEEFRVNLADMTIANVPVVTTKPPGYVWVGTADLPAAAGVILTDVRPAAGYGPLVQQTVDAGWKLFDAVAAATGAVDVSWTTPAATISAANGDAKTLTAAATHADWAAQTDQVIYLVPPGNWSWVIHAVIASVTTATTLTLEEWNGTTATTLEAWKLGANGALAHYVPIKLSAGCVLRAKTGAPANATSLRVWASREAT